jgi:restriction system protein
VADELAKLLDHCEPGFFEQLVVDLLGRMGYGTSAESRQRVGRSGDGGIDGIISLDRLGLEKIYIQAKKWARDRRVGRPEIQAFFGALAGQRATKGLFMTTAGFTSDAEDYAANVSGSLILVDGKRLVSLMIEHGVGVAVASTLTVPKVDTDYFED